MLKRLLFLSLLPLCSYAEDLPARKSNRKTGYYYH